VGGQSVVTTKGRPRSARQLYLGPEDLRHHKKLAPSDCERWLADVDGYKRMSPADLQDECERAAIVARNIVKWMVHRVKVSPARNGLRMITLYHPQFIVVY
jgi:hypothetical protein